MAMSGEEFVEWLDQELEPLRREATLYDFPRL
jgi:hypothetical protein